MSLEDKVDILEVIATLRRKAARVWLLGGGFGQKWIFANPAALINAAVTGKFTPSKRWDELTAPKTMQRPNEKGYPGRC